MLETSEEKKITHSVTSHNGAKFVLIGGQPLKEPVVSKGPFVMNTEEEIEDTYKDLKGGKNGFENAPHWQSKIKQLVNGKLSRNYDCEFGLDHSYLIRLTIPLHPLL